MDGVAGIDFETWMYAYQRMEKYEMLRQSVVVIETRGGAEERRRGSPGQGKQEFDDGVNLLGQSNDDV
jgi:hypothetical protein